MRPWASAAATVAFQMTSRAMIVALTLAVVPVSYSAESAYSSQSRDTLPVGWKDLAAAPFFEVGERLLTRGNLSVEVRSEVVQHAWRAFLNDPQFIAHADWRTMELALGWPIQCAKCRTLNADGSECASSVARADREMATLGRRTRSRLLQRNGLQPVVANLTYTEVQRSFYRLRWLGITDLQNRLLGQWVQGDQWRSSSLTELFELNQYFTRMAPGSMIRGVRWSGFLSAPVGDQYVISWPRSNAGSQAVRIWLDGKVVLASRGGEEMTGRCAADFRSQPIALAAGVYVPLKIEIVLHDPETASKTTTQPALVGAMLWESRRMPRQFVPQQAFSIPAGTSCDRKPGLRGEYFEDAGLEKHAFTRVDPAVDMMWASSSGNVSQSEYASLVQDECVRRILGADFFGSLSRQEKNHLINREVPILVGQVRLSMRGPIVRRLAAANELVRDLSEETIGRLLSDCYLLPGKEHLTLLGAWLRTRPQPRLVARSLLMASGPSKKVPGAATWTAALRGPYAEELVLLADDCLTRSNGECNLAVAYPLTVASQRTGIGGLSALTALVETRLTDHGLAGDKRTTWLLALAFLRQASLAEEADSQSVDHVEAALLEAVTSAESSHYRFWALDELVDRLSMMGQPDRVTRILDRHQQAFAAPAEQARILDWRIEMERLRQFPVHCPAKAKSLATTPFDSNSPEFRLVRLEPAAREVTLLYSKRNYIGPGVVVPDGFVDGDCAMQIHSPDEIVSSEEVMVVDRKRDALLARHIAFARSDVLKKLPAEERARRLAAHVAASMTPPGGNVLEKVDRMATRFAGREVLLGELPGQAGGAGVCRHRALLFKILADEAGLRVALVRGRLVGRGGHAWNELHLDDGMRIVDAMRPQAGFVLPRADEPSSRIYVTLDGEPWYQLDALVTKQKGEAKANRPKVVGDH